MIHTKRHINSLFDVPVFLGSLHSLTSQPYLNTMTITTAHTTPNEHKGVPPDEKPHIQEIDGLKYDFSWAEQVEVDEDVPPGFFGCFLKKNPSTAFIADVAKMNTMELDPKVIRRLERKIDLLIIPALATCYMVSSWPPVVPGLLISSFQFYYM